MTQFLFLRGPNRGNLVTIEYMPRAKHIGGTGSRQGSWLESASQPGKVEVAWLCPPCFYYKSDRVGLTECLVVNPGQGYLTDPTQLAVCSRQLVGHNFESHAQALRGQRHDLRHLCRSKSC